MKKIQLDCAPPGLVRSFYRTSFYTWLSIVIGLTICVSGGMAALHQQHLIDDQLAQIKIAQLMLNQRNEVKIHVTKKGISETQASAVNGAIAQLNLPWNEVFEALEAATPQTIALISLEPDARRNSVKGIAESKDSDDMVRYIEQLKKQPYFKNVFITMHDINQLDPNKPLRFQFEAYWQGSTS